MCVKLVLTNLIENAAIMIVYCVILKVYEQILKLISDCTRIFTIKKERKVKFNGKKRKYKKDN